MKRTPVSNYQTKLIGFTRVIFHILGYKEKLPVLKSSFDKPQPFLLFN